MLEETFLFISSYLLAVGWVSDGGEERDCQEDTPDELPLSVTNVIPDNTQPPVSRLQAMDVKPEINMEQGQATTSETAGNPVCILRYNRKWEELPSIMVSEKPFKEEAGAPGIMAVQETNPGGENPEPNVLHPNQPNARRSWDPFNSQETAGRTLHPTMLAYTGTGSYLIPSAKTGGSRIGV
ncbi:hypothetical protein NDU88_005120 [Pleurodeles waltl]|uniref:Uncharacterized protein n=1 Tax=Pleurodeles waltl TaxID=8319 RepID=A0AAV7WXD4_PLEWA|nr:hypothetical protein NDU88_005120 [Pleurodeles waltl]